MTSTKNIFELLDVGQDSDDDTQKNKNSKTVQKVQKDEGPKRPPIDAKVDELQKEQRKKNEKKTQPKEKGVSEEPHPKDRQSGTKYDGAMQKNKFRKGGAGNVGTLKDELTRGDQNEPVEENSAEEVAEVEQKPQFKTVQEYYSEMGVEQTEETQESKRAKLSEKDIADQLKKEKLQYVKTKEDLRQQEAATKQQPNKPKTTRSDYKAAFQSDKAELLGFKNGLIEVEYSEKPPRRENRDRDDNRRQERKPEGATTTSENQVEGEQKEGGNQGQQQDGQQGRRDNNNRGGDNRRQGDNRRGQQQGGERGENNRGERRENNRGGDKRRSGKGGSKGFNTNTEDFPTLG